MRTIAKIGKKNWEHFSGILPPQDTVEMALGLIEDGEPIGALSFSFEDDLIIIDSLFIAPDYRRSGAGTTLLNELTTIANQNSAIGIQMLFPQDDKLIAFFEHNGFFILPGDTAYSVSVAQLLISAESTLGKISPKNIRPLSSLLSTERKQTQTLLYNAGYDGNAISFMECNENLSFVVVDKNDMVYGLILTSDIDTDVFVNLLLVKNHKQSSGTEALQLLAVLLNTIKNNRPDIENFCFYAENESTYKLLKKFIKDDRQIKKNTLNYIGTKALKDEI